MEKEPKIKSLKDIPKAFIDGDVVDMDFREVKGFVNGPIWKLRLQGEWEKRREQIIKKGLP